MVRQANGRPAWRLMLSVMAMVAMAVPSAAQPGGSISGVVVDDSGQPVEGATVIIVAVDRARRIEVKTNADGEYLQLGLTSGPHQVSAELKGVTSQVENVEVVGSHIGLPSNPWAIYVVGNRLAQAAGNWQPFHRTGVRRIGFPPGPRKAGSGD